MNTFTESLKTHFVDYTRKPVWPRLPHSLNDFPFDPARESRAMADERIARAKRAPGYSAKKAENDRIFRNFRRREAEWERLYRPKSILSQGGVFAMHNLLKEGQEAPCEPAWRWEDVDVLISLGARDLHPDYRPYHLSGGTPKRYW
jgi:hypothetical protein